MIISIPMPGAKECSLNWRGHWAQRARAVKTLRGAAMICALSCSNWSRPNYEKAKVSITFVIPNRHHIKDSDNAMASIKPAIDGCVDAGIIVDDSPDHLQYEMPIIWQVDKERAPLTIIEIERLEK